MSALLMTSLLSGCGGGQSDAEKTQEAAQTQAQGENQSQAEAGETAAVNPDATEVLFWISLSGGMGETIEEIVNNYNASQDKVHVTVEFQGNYYDMAAKLQTAVTSGEMPHVAQLEMGRTKMFADYGVLQDMTELAQETGLDTSMFLKAL